MKFVGKSLHRSIIWKFVEIYFLVKIIKEPYDALSSVPLHILCLWHDGHLHDYDDHSGGEGGGRRSKIYRVARGIRLGAEEEEEEEQREEEMESQSVSHQWHVCALSTEQSQETPCSEGLNANFVRC